MSMGRKHLPVGAIDVTASALARIAPRRLRARIEQTRHDLLSLVGSRPPMAQSSGRRGRSRKPLYEIDPLEHLLPSRALRTRYVTWRTDLRWLARDLRGERRPTTIERRTGQRRTGQRPSSQRPSSQRPGGQRDAPGLFGREVEVVARTEETPDAVTLELNAGAEGIAFQAGQFLTFEIPLESGEVLRRAYSICCAPGEGRLAVTVKRIHDGRGSHWMHTHAHVGRRLRVLGPSGAFVLPSVDDGAPPELVLIGGGSGITPLRALAQDALCRGWRVHLLYGNRSVQDVIFGDELRRWNAPGWTLHEVLESAPDDFEAVHGRLDQATVRAWLDGLEGPHRGRLAYVCGPAGMRESATSALLAAGFERSAIREERFHSPASGYTASRDRTVTLRVLGARPEDRQVHVPAGQTLLEAGLRAGAALPFSCAMGGCAACKGTVVRGRVEMDEPNGLSPAERDAGAVLTCCARPLSDDVVVEVRR